MPYYPVPIIPPWKSMADILRIARTLPWRDAAKESYGLRPLFLAQFRHEDFRNARVLDVGTGDGRLAFHVASLGGRVIGVDIDRARLMQARSYAGVRGYTRVDFVWGDVEKSSYHDFSPNPFDFIMSNLCMSPEIVHRASRHIRPGGKMIFCCHHADHWKETGRGSRFSFTEQAMGELLTENRFDTEFMGVDTVVATFDHAWELEHYLPARIVQKWTADGRWQTLQDCFAKGERRLTSSFLIVKAKRLAVANESR